MTSNPHIRLIPAAAKFLVLNSKFDRVPHPWHCPLSRRKISCRRFVLFGPQPQSRPLASRTHDAAYSVTPQTHAVCSPRAELGSDFFTSIHMIC